jgi:hypothetical protein
MTCTTPSTSRSATGRVRNMPFSIVLSVKANGERGILGIWAAGGGEGASAVRVAGAQARHAYKSLPMSSARWQSSGCAFEDVEH